MLSNIRQLLSETPFTQTMQSRLLLPECCTYTQQYLNHHVRYVICGSSYLAHCTSRCYMNSFNSFLLMSHDNVRDPPELGIIGNSRYIGRRLQKRKNWEWIMWSSADMFWGIQCSQNILNFTQLSLADYLWMILTPNQLPAGNSCSIKWFHRNTVSFTKQALF